MKSFISIEARESRLFTSATLPTRRGVMVNSGSTRCLLKRLAVSTVGCTNSVGPGAWSTMYPSMLSSVSVLPVCAANISTSS